MVSGLNHKVLDRQPAAKSSIPFSTVGMALDSILTNLEDSSRFVEYWCRQEWRHIEAHADVDEVLARTSPDLEFSYPRNGHGLYLQIGSRVQGPTCVFPNVCSGANLVGPSNDDDNSNKHELVVVPAVSGRLLRFPGTALHAVPRPHNIRTLPFVQGAAEFKPESEWGRSVILFNTWNDALPLDIPLDEQEESIMNTNQNCVRCESRSEWNLQSVHSTDSSIQQERNTKRTKIWLLGDLKRRGYHQLRTVDLSAPENIDDILGEATRVQRALLRSGPRHQTPVKYS
jgi:hypothetical protein